ncbi:MAG: AMIN domain-containing protein, partial [Acidobacteriota bacterium]|nr:AMIN domain-containing protein [Acidobacteriota bacterium]
MKQATSRILLILFILFVGLGLDAKVTISKIEFFPGEDFVQLHMQTDKILPIPDIFYPEKDNLTRLVMRIKDVDFKVDKEALTFESPVIAGLKISNAAEYSDVEIMLKSEANYRVFTNQTGLYIEFPARKGPEVASVAPPAAKVEKAPAPGSQIATGSRVSIRDVRVASQEPGRIRFELALSRETEYRVIPIEQKPVRLAIDLKNARSAKINKAVNLKNVKGIRGGNNSDDVYRVVFDLEYLKHFAVQSLGSLLQVDFFDDPQQTQAAPAVAQAAELQAPPAQESPVQPVLNLEPHDTGKPEAKVLLAQVAEPAAQPREFFGPEKSKSGEEVAQQAEPAAASEGQSLPEFEKKTVDGGRPQYSGDPYDFSFKNADISNILKFIAKISGLNMVIDPDVTGRFTCELVQVPWDQALEMILKVNGLDMIQ